MTLLDLLALVRHHWRLMVFMPVVCAAVCFAVLSLMPTQYQASVVLNATGEAAGVGSIASSERSAADLRGANVSITTDTKAKTITITAQGGNADDCVTVANEIADKTVKRSATTYEKVAITAQRPDAATNSSPSRLRYTAIFFAAGCILALCIVVLIDARRTLVKNAVGLAKATALPILATLPSEGSSERLVANTRFASGMDAPATICVVPCGVSESAKKVCAAYSAAFSEENIAHRVIKADRNIKGVLSSGVHAASIDIICCNSTASGMSGIYIARESQVVVVSVQQWADSLADLEDTLGELSLADGNVVGLAYVQSKG